MPAWGVKSGKGAKDEQSIKDLVNYVESIVTTPAKAQADATKALEQTRTDATKSVAAHQKALTDAQAALAGLDANATATERAASASLGHRGADESRCRDRLEPADAGGVRRPDPVPEQLRAVSHAWLVVLRPQRAGANPLQYPMGEWRLRPRPHRRARQQPVPAAQW